MPKLTNKQLEPIHYGEDDTFGERLARLRKHYGYTQTELAGKIGIAQALISDYERNKTRPPAEMVVRLAQAMNISADELLGLEASSSKQHGNNRILRRLKKIEQLSPSDQKTVLKTLDLFLNQSFEK